MFARGEDGSHTIKRKFRKAEVETSQIASALSSAPVAPLAFAGFAPVQPDTGKSYGDRTKIDLRWGEKLLAAIRADDGAVVREALSNPLADVDATLQAGAGPGAPFAYADAVHYSQALFAGEQLRSVTELLLDAARAAAATDKRFVGPKEWNVVDRILRDAGRYAAGVPFASHVCPGDTGLHLSIRVGSLAAAAAFVECDQDVMLENANGERTAHLLARQRSALVALLERIGKLRADVEDVVRPLKRHEKLCLEAAGAVVSKIAEYGRVAAAVAEQLRHRQALLPALCARAVECELQRLPLSGKVQRELELAGRMAEDFNLCLSLASAGKS